MAHAGQHGDEDPAVAGAGGAAQHGIDGGAAEILGRVGGEPGVKGRLVAFDQQMAVAGGQIDVAGAQHLSIAGFIAGHGAQAGDVFREDRGEGRRHVLG